MKNIEQAPKKPTQKSVIQEAIQTRTEPFTIQEIINDVKEVIELKNPKNVNISVAKQLRLLDYHKTHKVGKVWRWAKTTKTALKQKSIPNDGLYNTHVKPRNQELNMAELGESVYEYIGSLKTKIQQLSDSLSIEQDLQKKMISNYKGQIKEKENTAARLNRKIIHLNQQRSNASDKTFKLGEMTNYNGRT